MIPISTNDSNIIETPKRLIDLTKLYRDNGWLPSPTEEREQSDEFLTPPPFEQCENCDGSGLTQENSMHCYAGEHIEITEEVECNECFDSPLLGYIPQYYTPEQYRDWIRRENDLPDYELPDDTVVWASIPNYSTWLYFWYLVPYAESLKMRDCGKMVVATIAGRPPKDWRDV